MTKISKEGSHLMLNRYRGVIVLFIITIHVTIAFLLVKRLIQIDTSPKLRSVHTFSSDSISDDRQLPTEEVTSKDTTIETFRAHLRNMVINNYGFDFNYESLGLDKLRTLYYKKEMYSKNQNG